MKTAPIFQANVRKNKLAIIDLERFQVWLACFEGQYVEVIVRKKTKKRTNNQNSYLWGIVYKMIADHSGYESVDEVHEAMKSMFLTVKRDNLPPTTRSTTDLNTAEFSEYVESIKRWAANFLGIYIPEAGESELIYGY